MAERDRSKPFKEKGRIPLVDRDVPICCPTHMTVRFGFQSLELNKLKQMSPLVYMC